MIAFYKRSIRQKNLKEIKKLERGCWVNVVNPTDSELEFLQKELKLDEQNILSGLDQNEVPRVEEDEGIVYIILRNVSPDKNKKLQTFMIVITDTFILTFTKYKVDFIDRITNGKVDFITTQRSKCLLKLLSMINKNFELNTLDTIRLVNQKRESFTKLSEKDIPVLLEQESILNNFVSSYYYSTILYERMTKFVRVFEEDKEILEDLMIEAQQGLDLCKSTLKTISNIRSHYEILLSNKLNKVITMLTIFTVFISIPSAIAGIYGMNILLPLQSAPNAFYYIIISISILWIALLAYFKKSDII